MKQQLLLISQVLFWSSLSAQPSPPPTCSVPVGICFCMGVACFAGSKSGTKSTTVTSSVSPDQQAPGYTQNGMYLPPQQQGYPPQQQGYPPQQQGYPPQQQGYPSQQQGYPPPQQGYPPQQQGYPPQQQGYPPQYDLQQSAAFEKAPGEEAAPGEKAAPGEDASLGEEAVLGQGAAPGEETA